MWPEVVRQDNAVDGVLLFKANFNFSYLDMALYRFSLIFYKF